MIRSITLRTVWAAMLVLGIGISGCGPNSDDVTVVPEDKRPILACSTTQVADFARQVVGDRYRVQSVLSPGADPHLYEIKPSDAQLVVDSKLCAENGLHLEGGDWMRKLAEEAGKENALVTCTAGVQPLELDEGDQKVKDPHAWFSPVNAKIYVNNILEAVCKDDPDHASEYRARASMYLQQIDALDRWAFVQFEAIPPSQRVLVTSHDAFNYFCAHYGFKSSAPVGWSTGSEIGGGLTADRRKMVVDSIRNSGVKAIFVETSVNPKLIREIAKEAGVEIGGKLYSDSMGPPGSAGETYLGMMRENVLTIVEALRE
jgi:manganese/iron transport system substrate-binding protein